MLEISDKARESINQTVQGYPEAWTYGVCAFTFVDPKSGETSGRKNGAECHAGVGYGDRTTTHIVVNAHKPKWHKPFTLWVARESPFSSAVLNKDNEDEILNHASVMDASEVGKGGVLWLCKAFRHNVEDTWKPPMWEKLCEHGLTGLQAFIGADILDADGRPYKATTHCGLFSYMSPEALRTVYDEILTTKGRPGDDAGRHHYSPIVKDMTHLNKEWGSAGYIIDRKPDGWGGFVDVKRPVELKEYVAKLKEIFEGDPKNVK